MRKVDKVMYKVGIAGILVAAFCMGWNSDYFSK
jgi:hypothetical protein